MILLFKLIFNLFSFHLIDWVSYQEIQFIFYLFIIFIFLNFIFKGFKFLNHLFVYIFVFLLFGYDDIC